MSLLGLDIGTKRTGVALARANQQALEFTTLPTDQSLATKLKEICEAEQVETIVVGLPFHADGNLSTQAAWTMEKIKQLQSTIDLPITTEDEHLTTAEASRQMSQAGLPSPAIEARIDQYAAKLILEQFLSRQS